MRSLCKIVNAIDKVDGTDANEESCNNEDYNSGDWAKDVGMFVNILATLGLRLAIKILPVVIEEYGMCPEPKKEVC